jgi:hypothetical protein
MSDMIIEDCKFEKTNPFQKAKCLDPAVGDIFVFVKGQLRTRRYFVKSGARLSIFWRCRKHKWAFWLVKDAPKITITPSH